MIYIVGAGPGDPRLLTLRAQEVLEAANIVLYDALVDPAILKFAPPSAELIRVGKREVVGSSFDRDVPARTGTDRSGGAKTQEEINRLLVFHGNERPKAIIVRLKGGDPFLFGRGGEEGLALAEAGLNFEVVPGVTSPLAAAAYAGVPITHRSAASTVTFLTGTRREGGTEKEYDYEALVRLGGTLVFMMAVSKLEEITQGLLNAGAPASLLVTFIQWGTRPNQLVLSAPLSEIAQVVREGNGGSPAVIIVGEVGRLREKLAWFERLPLYGKRVLLTMTAPALAARELRAAGADVMEFSLLQVLETPPENFSARLERFSEFEGIIFTSHHAVRIFAELLSRTGKDARVFCGRKVLVSGVRTADELRRRLGINADIVPDEPGAAGIIENLSGSPSTRYLHICSEKPWPKLSETLGKRLEPLPVYKTEPVDLLPIEKTLAEGNVDAVVFSSPKGVEHFFTMRVIKPNFVSIALGPSTGAALKKAGVDAVRCDEISPSGITESLRRAL